MSREKVIPNKFGEGLGLVGGADIEKTFEKILSANDPILALSATCREIPLMYSATELSRLHAQGKVDCLGFACLSTLNSCLADFQDFPELGVDLVEEGMVVLFQTISEWSPSQRSGNGEPVPLKQSVGGEIRLKLTEFVLREYGLNGVEDFPLVRLYRKCWGEFVTEHGRQPEFQEINALVEVRNSEAGEPVSLFLWENTGESRASAEDRSKVQLMYRATQRIYSEDSPSEFDGEKILSRHCLESDLRQAMGTLSSIEKTALELRYFPGDGKVLVGNQLARTQDQVANYLGIDRERFRQVEAKALRKLRHPSLSRKVRDYLS